MIQKKHIKDCQWTRPSDPTRPACPHFETRVQLKTDADINVIHVALPLFIVYDSERNKALRYLILH